MATRKEADDVIPCVSRITREMIVNYAEQLKERAHTIGDHGLTKKDFVQSGLFGAAIERLRGQQAATTKKKRIFVEAVFDKLKDVGKISEWVFEGSADRHDYKVILPDGWVSIVETKGCLDGNNTNIFERPQNADEFIIWSLCQNPGADPGHNAWSGIHTRLSAEIISRKQQVDGLIIWDMLCGTAARPCPKITGKRKMISIRKMNVPPPCIYLFPRSIPDARNNPKPPCRTLPDVRLLHALHETFGGKEGEVTSVCIEAASQGNDIDRKTTFFRGGNEVAASAWTTIRRARG